MFTEVFNVIMTGVSACFDWFEVFANRIGFGGLLLSLFTIATVVRLLLQPIMGQASSDFASRSISSVQSKSSTGFSRRQISANSSKTKRLTSGK